MSLDTTKHGEIREEVNRLFAERLLAAREEKGIPQVRLTMMTGIAQSQISRYEGGHAAPAAHMAVILASALGVSTDWLYGIDVLQVKYGERRQ